MPKITIEQRGTANPRYIPSSRCISTGSLSLCLSLACCCHLRFFPLLSLSLSPLHTHTHAKMLDLFSVLHCPADIFFAHLQNLFSSRRLFFQTKIFLFKKNQISVGIFFSSCIRRFFFSSPLYSPSRRCIICTSMLQRPRVQSTRHPRQRSTSPSFACPRRRSNAHFAHPLLSLSPPLNLSILIRCNAI